MVDVVVNQMAWIGSVSNVEYNTLIPFNNESYYHSYCPITNNAIVVCKFESRVEDVMADIRWQCWQGGGDVQLPDLRTEDTDVRTIFGTFISNLVTTYNSEFSYLSIQ
jgi:alpha-amylase